PDVDAFCSALLLKITLGEIYPQKEFVLQTRQSPTIKLARMKDIEIVNRLESAGFDLIIVTDAGDISLCVTDEDNIGENIQKIYIDHHDTFFTHIHGELLINNNMSSASEEVYELLKNIYGKKFKLDEEKAELVQYGIVADTGRFLYDVTTPNTHRVFADAKSIVDIDLEDFAYRNSKFPREATPAIIKYLESLTIEKDMAYMSIDRETLENNQELKQGASTAQSFLRDKYLRFIQGVHWGFIVKPDMNIDNTWFVSFRSTKGYQNVKVIAEDLGGGGHLYSAGVQMKANSLDELLERVLEVCRKHSEDEKENM
ncbi:MAG TPA: DHH family phosphoesterase, partial [Candidatus Pacearchaeota archaeon]|nr:DHH family phosphoesterase [Candidatus Pacearchaeota archaeon]